jgi:hypothetical protein
MTVLYITEYLDIDGARQIPREPALASQTVAIGSSSTTSNPFNSQTTVVRLHTDAICSVLIGPVGTAASPLMASTANGRMAAGQTEFRGLVLNGPPMQVAVTVNT